MAQVTGSTTIDWSGVSLAQVDIEPHLGTFVTRVDQLLTEIDDPANYSIVVISPTLVVLDLVSGGRLRIGNSGSNFSVSFSNSDTGEVLRYTGRILNSNGDELLTSATIGSTGFSETIKGNIFTTSTFPPVGTYAGTVTSLVVKIGSATATFSGDISLAGDIVSTSLTGTVRGISVVSGANRITMTGLSLSLDDLEAALSANTLGTVNDLFAFVGSQMPSNDTITYTNNSGAGMTFFGGAGNDTITIKGPNDDTLNGGGGDDILTGGLGADTVDGEAGDDRITMLVTVGNVDTIDAGANNDTLVLSGVVPGTHEVVVDLSSLTDQVVAIGNVADALTQVNFEHLNAAGIGSFVTVTGSAGNNTIIGSKGNDSINGALGNDTMSGGLGNDTYTVDNVSDVVAEAVAAGIDKVFSSSNAYTLTANVEQLELTGTADSHGTGNTLANILTGNSGVNVLTGLAGNDTYVVQNDTDVAVEALAAGIDLVQSTAANFTLGANVENLTLLGITNINGTGNTLNNLLTGNSGHNTLSGEAGADRLLGGDGDDTLLGGLGNDVLIGGIGADNLDGGAGTDSMAGGQGNDTYVVSVATDVVTEALNAGTDTVVTSLNYTLGANVENLTLTGTAINGTGNALANVLTGNGGNNTLSGLAGTDTLNGGDGNDLLLGGLGQDIVNGDAGDDRITMLVTAGNRDTIHAGADNDTLVLSGIVPGNHEVVVDLSSVTDQVVSIGGPLLLDAPTQINFEHLTAAGISGFVTVTGSDEDNIIVGSNGIDTIDGGAGNDTLEGGLGGDTLIGGLDNDTMIGGGGADSLQGGAGDDLFLIRSTAEFAVGETIDGGANVDRLRYTGTAAATLTLNSLVTNIEQVEIADASGNATGLAAINITAAAVATGLTITGNNGANRLMGTIQADILRGNGGVDTLTGGAGNDTLIGGTGNDILRGGLGNDIYQVAAGDGKDRIVESDGTPGNSDTLLYGGAIDPQDLVLSRQVNDLRIALHGTADNVTIQNWFTQPATAQIETIQAGTGQTLLNTDVAQLIQAMATFTTTTGLSWDAASGGAGDAAQQTQFQGIIATSWQP